MKRFDSVPQFLNYFLPTVFIVCNWDGINCDPADGETIVGIKISSSDFTGTITSEIGKLTSLLEFSIPQNKVHGTIPQALAK